MNYVSEGFRFSIFSGAGIAAIAIATSISVSTPVWAEECLLDNGAGFGIIAPNEGQAYSQGDVLLFGGNPDTDGGADGTGTASVACGEGAIATGDNTTAVGQAAMATEDNATSIGQAANASAQNSVAIGTGSIADVADTVSVGSAGSERRITNVADATTATDAATLGQVQAADAVNAAAAAAAQATADANSVNIATNTSSIATNTSNIATNTSNIATNTSNIATNSSFISRNSRNISRNWNQINGNTKDIAETRAMVGVNSSAIASNANDIQLNRQNIFGNTNSISALSADLDGFKKDSRSGIAAASAFVEPWSDGAPGTTIAVGAASYDGENAMSLNFGFKPKNSNRVDLIGGVSFASSGDDIFRLGLRYRWPSGNKSSGISHSNDFDQTEINNALRAKLAAQDEKLEAQEKALAKLSDQLTALLDEK